MQPKVGVVVPIYNVETYLEECLTSIAGQTLRDLEVVMVDDGSTDSSGEIAARFAAKDDRFQLVRQENAGLGNARNVGASHVRGEYLSFVDSDDILPEHAYELMANTLDRTGSDFASGNTKLLTSAGVTQSPMHRRPMGSTRLRTHITRDELLMYDRLAPNKLFRRSFWDEHGLKFPEGVLYEDIPVTIPAHYLAKSVDVLSDAVYYWRQRDGVNLSITQRRTEPRAVEDRFRAIESVTSFLDAQPKDYRAQRRAYEKVALRSDLRIFLDVLPDGDEAFRQRFLELAQPILERVGPKALQSLPAILRLKWHLASLGKIPELLKVIEFERKGGRIPVARRGRRRYAKYPYFGDKRLNLPRELFELRDELTIQTRLHEITWRNGKLHVSGHAYIGYVGIPTPASSLKVAAVREDGTGRTKVLPAWPRRCRNATATSRQAKHNLDWSGFSFTLDPKSLRKDGRYQDGLWLVAAGVYARGVFRRGALTAAPFGSGAHPDYHYVTDDVRVVPVMSRGGTLRIKVETVRAKLIGQELTGDGLVLRGKVRGELPEGTRLLLRRSVGTVAASYPVTAHGMVDGGSGTAFAATVPLEVLREQLAEPDPSAEPGPLSQAETDDGAGLRIDLALGDAEPDEEPARLVLDESQAEARHVVDGRELVVARSAAGYSWLYVRTPRGVITDASWLPDGSLSVSGDYAGAGSGPCELVLVHRDQREERAFPLTAEDGRFSAVLPVHSLESLAGTLPLRAGRWDLRIRTLVHHSDGTAGSPEAGHGAPRPLAVKLDRRFLDRLPLETETSGRRYVLEDRGHDKALLEVHSDLRAGERGAYGQRRTRIKHYRLTRKVKRLRPAVLYDSFTGKQYSDSPRAVHEEFVRRGVDLEHLWVVRDQQVEVPETAKAVRLWSAEWYEALARSRYVITNAHLPAWFRRRDGQVVVQAWHGTPLKRIGFDIEDVQFANSGYLDKVAKETKSWTHLISPNRFSTPILRRAFRFDGNIIETGYPRNDILLGPDADAIGSRVRERLGIPAGKRTVLYAPTWRDDSFYGPGKYKLDLRLDLAKAARELGDDHVLLIRRHPNVVDTVPEDAGGFVRDVSDYPDIAELFLAADVLMTDYSSLMFDYANTRRPMLFFTYDLEHYRDQLRGFYFDFEEEAPGPLLSTSDEVIEALRSLDQTVERHREAYQRFVEKFCDLDDGKAAGRVVDLLLEGR